MPEERARIEVDGLAALLLCPDERSVATLRSEGVVGDGAVVVGDVMADATLRFAPIARERVPPPHAPGAYVVATVHREANVRPERLRRIVDGLSRLDEPVVFPAHPRTAAVLAASRIPLGPGIELREPMGYLAFASAASQARVIATDSGGLQKEAYWFRVPCVTMRPSTEWVDTVEAGANILVDDAPTPSRRRCAPRGSRRAPRRSTATVTQRRRIARGARRPVTRWTVSQGTPAR